MTDQFNLQQIDSALSRLETHVPVAQQEKPKNKSAIRRNETLNDRFTWLSDIEESGEEIEWIWEGYIAPGLVSLLTADPKAGKTTLLAHLFHAMENSEEFLGRKIKKANVLVLTEETKGGWLRKKQDTQIIGNNVGIVSRYFYDRNQTYQWEEAIRELREFVRQQDIKLVVLDTLGYFWPVVDENHASMVTEALKPIHLLTEAGLAVLLIHHDRKTGGSNIKKTRGSSALSGFVDIKLGLTGDDTNKRTLRGDGRYEETPSKVEIELIEEDGIKKYILINTTDPAPDSQVDKLKNILHLFPTDPDGISVSEVLKNWDIGKLGTPPHKDTLRRWLKEGENNQIVKVVGHADGKGKAELWGQIIEVDEFEPEGKEEI